MRLIETSREAVSIEKEENRIFHELQQLHERLDRIERRLALWRNNGSSKQDC